MEQATSREQMITAPPEPLYRLALLVTANEARAAEQVARACAAVAPDSGDEAALLRGLLPAPARYGRWKPSAAACQRANVSSAQADTLLNLLARRAPAVRLAIGMHYLRGMQPDDIEHVLGAPADVASELARFRADATIAFGNVAPDADTDMLVQIDQALDGALDEYALVELRGRIFADATLRAQRDALMQLRALLLQALPGLFAVAAPGVLPRLRKTRAARQSRPHTLSLRAVSALVAAVLLVAALIVVVPGLLPRRTAGTTARSAPAVLEAAIQRFAQPPIGQGILHERYRVEVTGQRAQIIERWYDYGSPARLAVDVRDASSAQPRFGIRADGQGKVQYLLDQSQSADSRLDYQMSADEAQAAIPALRGILTPNRIFGTGRSRSEISGLYLAQARTLGATLLGRTSTGGREAWLLRYTTDRLPNDTAAGPQRQVLLSIDTQVAALLNITVLAEGASESTTYQPWRAELVEVLDQVPEPQFAFAQTANVQTIVGPHSVLLPNVPTSSFTSLLEAQRSSQQPLLAPRTPPASTRGVVLEFQRGSNARYGLLYEGEFQNLVIFPGDIGRSSEPLENEEHVIGDYRYRLATPPNPWRGGMLAFVYRPETPQERTSVLLMDDYATPSEREQHLRTLLESLAPVTAANVDSLSAQFAASSQAGE